jgi:hypothetical protein
MLIAGTGPVRFGCCTLRLILIAGPPALWRDREDCEPDGEERKQEGNNR